LRVRRVSLTAEGRKLVSRILVAHADQIKSLFRGLQPSELDGLLGLLRKVEDNLGNLAPTKKREQA
jgi:DNA-binding MarR family transcriptional regulator